jgi:hypothetical protein
LENKSSSRQKQLGFGQFKAKNEQTEANPKNQEILHMVYQGPALDMFFRDLVSKCGSILKPAKVNDDGSLAIVKEDLAGFNLFSQSQVLIMDLEKISPDQKKWLKELGFGDDVIDYHKLNPVLSPLIALSTHDWHIPEDGKLFNALEFRHPDKGQFDFLRQQYKSDIQAKLEKQKVEDLIKFLNQHEIFRRLSSFDHLTELTPYFEIIAQIKLASDLHRQIGQFNKRPKGQILSTGERKELETLKNQKQAIDDQIKTQKEWIISQILSSSKTSDFQETLESLRQYLQTNNSNYRERDFGPENFIDFRLNMLRDWHPSRLKRVALAITATDAVGQNQVKPAGFEDEDLSQPTTVWVTLGGGEPNLYDKFKISNLRKTTGADKETKIGEIPEWQEQSENYLCLQTNPDLLANLAETDPVRIILEDIRQATQVEGDLEINLIQNHRLTEILFGSYSEGLQQTGLERLRNKLNSLR